ncbi:BTB/POZ protein [Trichoderma gracile]
MTATVPTAGVDFRDLLRSGQFSDLTVVCRGTEFKLHKIIACLQSPVFLAAVNSDFQEGRTGVIKIDQFDPETVRCLVEFLYTGDYDSQPHQELQPVQEQTRGTVLHVRVNAIADYYGVKALGHLATQKVEQAFQDKWDPKVFLITAKEALGASGDKTLHDSMAKIAAENMTALAGCPELTDLVGDFSAEIMRHQGEKHAYLAAMRQQAETGTARVVARFGQIIAEVNQREFCRNGACGEASFGCNIEQVDSPIGEPTYILRCSYCRCRHWVAHSPEHMDEKYGLVTLKPLY